MIAREKRKSPDDQKGTTGQDCMVNEKGHERRIGTYTVPLNHGHGIIVYERPGKQQATRR